MGIKEDIETEQHRLFSSFVSVRALIESLAADQECSLSEVAVFLLNKVGALARDEFPEFMRIDPARLRIEAEDCADPLLPLDEIARGNPINDDLNYCGWRRHGNPPGN